MSVDLKAVDVEAFLKELSMRNVSKLHGKSGVEWRFSCPFPGHAHGDSNPSAFMNAETTAWKCWGCGLAGNAVTFLAEYENVSPLVAARWIRERFEGGFREPKGPLWNELHAIFNARVEGIEPLRVLDKAEADKRRVSWQEVYKAAAGGKNARENVPAPFLYMLDRGFMWDTLEEWDVGFDKLSNRISIPLHDHDGTLVGFKGRAWHPDSVPKYLVLGGLHHGFAPVEISRIVFGLHRAKYHAENGLVVIEGELNVIASQQKGFENACGIGGQFVSPEQAKILRHFTDSVTLLFDDQQRAWMAAEMLEPYLRVRVCETHEADPAEMEVSVLQELVDSAVPSTMLV